MRWCCIINIGKEYVNAVLAGMCIGIGGIINLSVDNKYIGALLFSFGLITILTQKWSLFTGRIGYINLKDEKILIPIILFGNYIGTAIISCFALMTRYGADLSAKAYTLCQNKLADTPISIFVLSILCGVMMFLAVDNYKQPEQEHIILIILPVVIFILSGFEHSIANMFYFNMACIASIQSLTYIAIMIIGNAIGAKLIYFLKN